jgi:DNA polymerase-3 subunit gamma/tau
MSTENLKRVSEQSKQISLDEIDFAVTKLSKTINDARWSTNPRVLFELAIVSIAAGENYEEKIVRRAPAQVTIMEPVKEAPASVSSREPFETEVKASQRIKTVESHSHEYDELWNSIFEEGEASDGSYNLIRLGTKISKMTEDTFTVIANGSFTQGYVEQKKADLERFMSAKLGKKMRLVCKLQSQQEEVSEKDDTDKIAREAEELLGIKIDIE